MNILLQAVVIVALIVPIIIGLLLGSMRGMRRSIIRIILVALSIVAAFCLKGVITAQVMNIEVNGQPLSEAIAQELFQGQNIPTETIENVVSLLIMALVFLSSLSILLFVTWAIIFPVCKLFLRSKKHSDGNDEEEGKKRKKHKKHNWLSRTIGSILGLAQGIAVAVVCVTVLNGLFFNLSNVAATVNDMQQDNTAPAASVDGGQGGEGNLEDFEKFFNSLIDYNDSGIRKFINKMGGDKLFDKVVSIETEEGKKLTLTGQIDALSGLVRMGNELSAIQNLEMTGGLNADTAGELTAIFGKLDEINGKLSAESKDTINSLIKSVADNLLPPEMNLDSLDFNKISFSNEGQVIANLSSYKETDFSSLSAEEAEQKAEEIVNTVMQSDILLPLLSSNSEFTIGLTGDNYELAKDVIEKLEQNPESDKDKVEMLKSFFGLNSETNGGTTPEQPVEPVPEQPIEPENPDISE